MLAKLGDKPTVGIPTACGGWQETRAAYCLFDHPAATAPAVPSAHRACTLRTPARPPAGAVHRGHHRARLLYEERHRGLGTAQLESRWGMYLHSTLALIPSACPWGYSICTHGPASPVASTRTLSEIAPSKTKRACVGWTATRRREFPPSVARPGARQRWRWRYCGISASWACAFAWVGVDGGYGKEHACLCASEDLGETFVADAHKNQRISLCDPDPRVPESGIM